MKDGSELLVLLPLPPNAGITAFTILLSFFSAGDQTQDYQLSYSISPLSIIIADGIFDTHVGSLRVWG